MGVVSGHPQIKDVAGHQLADYDALVERLADVSVMQHKRINLAIL